MLGELAFWLTLASAPCTRAPDVPHADMYYIRLGGHETVAPPNHYLSILQRLVRVTNLSTEIRLIGVVGQRAPALVFGNGAILISDRVWESDWRLAEDEVAAIFAHELAHLQNNDIPGCKGDPKNVETMKRNHAIEYRADYVATQLLELAGYSSQAMRRLLIKISGRGEPSGTHPAIERRLENLK